MSRIWGWIVAVFAAVGAGLLVVLGLRARNSASRELADQAIKLAERELEREQYNARTEVEQAVEEGRASADSEIAIIDREVAEEARSGGLGDAINQLRGGG